MGNLGCLAIDRMLPEHLPTKQPNNFPVSKRGGMVNELSPSYITISLHDLKFDNFIDDQI